MIVRDFPDVEREIGVLRRRVQALTARVELLEAGAGGQIDALIEVCLDALEKEIEADDGTVPVRRPAPMPLEGRSAISCGVGRLVPNCSAMPVRRPTPRGGS